MTRTSTLAAACLLGLAAAACKPAVTAAPAAAEAPHVVAASDIDAGRYLVRTSGCNDCHTPGYAPSGGKVPESQHLTGARFGFKGPWGVTYPHNLRITVANMSEDAWVEMLNTREDLPPMPWPSVRSMSDADKRAVYRYIRSLGPGGQPAPAAVPPGVTPTMPYEDMTIISPTAG